MGAGKTTIGIALSELWKCAIHDTDQMIEQTEKMKITEIFSKNGEDYFRNKETFALSKTLQTPGIVTTGGGVVLKEENRKLLKENGLTLFLRNSPESVWDRLVHDQSRPLLINKNKEEVYALYEQRLSFYEQCADLIIDTTELNIDETVNKIRGKIRYEKNGFTTLNN